MIYFFEGHSLDSERRELRRGDAVIPLEPQVFDLLHYLLRHRGRVVSKDELVADVWQGRIVSDSTLGSRIFAVRHALGDSGERQAFVRTVARKGLRFVAPVREEAIVEGNSAASTAMAAAQEQPATSPAARPAERRQLSIVACGIAEPMALAARLDPEDLRELLAAWRRVVARVAAEHRGSIASDTGDRIELVFGFPLAQEDDAERAVRAALSLDGATAALARARPCLRLHCHAAVATGAVVIDADSDAPRIAGATQLRAAQLLAQAPSGAVYACIATRQLVGALFDCREVAPRAAANGEQPAAQVFGERVVASRFDALRPTRVPLVGRDEELALLLRRWEQIAAGEGRVVLLTGEAGIGKSRLVAALQEAIAADAHDAWRYACAPHRRETALYPVIAQLERRAGFQPDDSAAAKRERLARLLAPTTREGDSEGARQGARDLALLAELLGIAADAVPGLSAARRRELLLDCLAGQVGVAARQAPLLLIVEDAHWIDPTSRELFDRLIELLRDLPVLLVMTYRPEFAAPWVGQSHVTVLVLNRLDRRDNAQLVRHVAGRALPAALVEQIVARTDGVPLFIEELTKAMLEGALDVDAADGGAVVPATLQASLVARFDRLPAARGLVQTCAALGREFSHALLQATAGLPAPQLEASMAQLVDAELVHARGAPPHAVYSFKHALVQDAAYATMLRPQRAAAHARIVAVLEHEFAGHCARHPDELAHHCAEAGLWERAIDARIRAAHMARERSAGVEAQAQVEAALRLLPKVEVGAARQQLEGRLQVALGQALAMTRGFAAPEVMASLSAARDLLDAAQYPIESLAALCGLFNFHMIRSESPACLSLAAPFLESAPDQPQAAVANYLVGTAHLHLGNFRPSIDHLERALALYDEAACRPLEFIAGYYFKSFSLIWLGLALLYTGEPRRAMQTIAAAVNDARRRAHPFTLVSALLALARFRNQVGDIAGAIEATDEAARIASEQRSPYHQSRAAILHAVNLVDSGQARAGIAHMERALAAHRATGANFQSAYNLSRLAQAHALAGDGARALELATQAVAEVERTGERWWEAEAHRIRGELLLAAGRAHRDAVACFEHALACARRQQARLWELRAALSLAQQGSAQVRNERAHTVLQPVLAHFNDGVELAELQEARRLIVQAARA